MKNQRWVWGLAIVGLLVETLVTVPVWVGKSIETQQLMTTKTPT